MNQPRKNRSVPDAPAPGGDASGALAARDYDAVVVNPNDATEIAITVLQPELAAGEAAPLIVHGHGFGGSRLRGRDQLSIYEQLSGGPLPSTEAARRAAASGYFVISFDQRGFGDSTGKVRLMDPDCEGADIRAILDWAEQAMAGRGHLAYRNGAPVVGALGLSYGGGFQLVGACVDARFTAIVPTATWHDLGYSLAPDNVVKTAWGTALVALGLPTSGVDLDGVIYRALLEGLASPLTGLGLSNTVADRFYNQSPASFLDRMVARNGHRYAASRQRPAPQVDALLIQGVGDTLFNLNEALANAHGLCAAGNDVHVIAMRHGHSLPFLQNIERIAYQTEASLHWGDQRVETAQVELAYLDWKLKGAKPDPVLAACTVILDDDTGLVFDAMPTGIEAGGERFDFKTSAVTGGLDLLLGVLRENMLGGLWDVVTGAMHTASEIVKRLVQNKGEGFGAGDTTLLSRLINALPADTIDELASGGVFVSLTTIKHEGRAVVGVPTTRITVSGDSPSPAAFVGLGIKRTGQRTTILVNKQIRPIRACRERDVELNGVAERLLPGDQLGVLVYGFHPQYLASFSAIPGRLKVRGRIDIPIIDVADHERRSDC